MELLAAKLFLASLLFASSIIQYGRYLLQRAAKIILPVSALIIFGVVFYYIRQQFFLWHDGEFTKVFVPPYAPTGIGYFLFGYVLPRFLAPYLISLCVAGVFLLLAVFFNRKYGERFFHKEEPYLAAVAIFLVGYPGLIYYLILLCAVFLIFHVSCLMFRAYRGRRLSLYYFWLPLAVIVILMERYAISYLPLFVQFKV